MNKIIFFSLILTCLILAPSISYAQYQCCVGNRCDRGNYPDNSCSGNCLSSNCSRISNNFTSPGTPTTLTNPLGNATPNELIGRVINAILGVTGSLALLMFVYGGLTWMTASGAQDKVQKGKDIIMWATIGLIVIFSSYALVNFVLTNVIGGGAVQ